MITKETIFEEFIVDDKAAKGIPNTRPVGMYAPPPHDAPLQPEDVLYIRSNEGYISAFNRTYVLQKNGLKRAVSDKSQCSLVE